MTKRSKQKLNSVFSITNMILMTLQSFMPGFFLLLPANVHAAEVQDETIEVVVETVSEEVEVIEEDNTEYVLEAEEEVKIEVLEVTPTEELATPIEEETETPVVETVEEIKVVEEITEPVAGPAPKVVITTEEKVIAAEEVTWTIDGNTALVDTVELGVVYTAPQNGEVQVVFTKLPENSGSLTIEEIELSDEVVEQVGAYSNVAYDITSDMADGTFEYELKLPLPEGADDNAGLVYAESVEELNSAVAVDGEVIEDGKVVVTGLDHFTVFVITGTPGSLLYEFDFKTFDNGAGGLWATDYIHAQLELIPDGDGCYLYTRVDTGIFETLDGRSPANLEDISSGIKGDLAGGISGRICGSIIEDMDLSYEEDLTVGSYPNYATKYFGRILGDISGFTFNSSNGWGWTFTTCNNGTWIDTDSEVSGDVSGEYVACVDTTSPAQPTGMRILNNIGTDLSCDGYVTNRLITIDWSDNTESDFDHYDYRIREGNIIQHPTLSELTGNIRDEDGYYKYGVRAVDTTGNVSEWSDWCGITLDREAPDAPTLVEPLNNSRVNGAVLLSDWTEVNDSVKYIYESYHNETATNLRWHAEYTASEKTAHNVGESTFWWRVKAVDAAGNESGWSELWKVTIDNTAPAKPTGLRRLLASDHSIVYECGDSSVIQSFHPDWDDNTTDSDFSHYEYSSFNANGGQGINERRFDESIFEYNGSWLPGDGTYGFAVRAVDFAGNKSDWALTDETLAGSCQITYDSTAPSTPEVLGFLSPDLDCGAITDIHSTTVDWTDSIDSGIGFDHYIYSINYPKPNGTRGDWTTTMAQSQYGGSLNEGAHHVRVKGVDVLGNESDWSNTCTITTDWTAPVTTLTSPSDGDETNQDILIEGSSTDVGIVDHVNLYYRVTGDTAWTLITALDNGSKDQPFSFSHSWTPPSDATYDFKAAGVDTVGNEEQSAYVDAVTYDTVAPVVTWDNPTNDELVDGNVALTAICDGGDTESTYVNFWWWKSSEGQTVIDARDGSPKQYNRVGRTSPNGGTVVGNTYSYTLDTEDEALIQSAYDWSGEWRLRAACKDAAGNYDHSEIDMNVDNVKPDLAITTPGNDTIHNGLFSIQGTASDDGSDIKDIRVRFRNESDNALIHTFWASYDDSTDTWSLDINDGFSDVADGYYKIVVRAGDNSTNVRFKTLRRIYIDSTKPSSTITTFDLEDDGKVETATFSGLIEGTAIDEPTDIGSGVAEVLLEIMHTPFGATESSYWHGTDWQTGSALVQANGTTTWEYQITPEEKVLEGTYVVSSHAVDNAGNMESTYTITIVYDKTIPEVILTIDPTDPDGKNAWYVTEPTVTLTANDNYNVDYIEYQWNSTVGTWTTYTAPINPPGEGQNVLYYRSVDVVGNVSDLGVKEVKFDKTAPTEGAGNLKVRNIRSTTAEASWDKPENSSEIEKFVLIWKHEDGKTRSDSVSGDTYEFDLYDLFDGEWELTLESQDDAGHAYSVTEKFTVGGSSGDVLGTTDEAATSGFIASISNFINDALDSKDETKNSDSETKSEESNNDSGSVLGDSDSSCLTWQYYLPLFLLLIQLMFAVSLEIANREPGKKKLIMALGASALVIGAFYILKNAACYGDTTGLIQTLSKWFVPLSLVLAAILRLMGSMTVEEK